MHSTKKQIKSFNIFDSIKPFYYLSKCFGTVPFTLTVKNNVISIKTTRKDYLIFVIFNVFHAYLFYFFVRRCFFSNWNNVNFKQYIMMFITLGFSIVFNFINYLLKESTIRIIKALIKIDASLNLLSIEIAYKSQGKIITYFVLICLLIYTTLTGISFYIYVHLSRSSTILLDFPIAFTVILNNIFYTNVISQFVVFLLAVYNRFKILNERLVNMFKINYLNNMLDLSGIVRKISEIHDDLNEIVEMINLRFSIWIMMIIAAVFIYGNIFILLFLKAIIFYDKISLLLTLPRFIWSLNYTLFIVLVVGCGSGTTRIVILLEYGISVSSTILLF